MCEKYGRDRQTTDNNIIRRMGVTFWITKATNSLQNTYYLIPFYANIIRLSVALYVCCSSWYVFFFFVVDPCKNYYVLLKDA